MYSLAVEAVQHLQDAPALAQAVVPATEEQHLNPVTLAPDIQEQDGGRVAAADRVLHARHAEGPFGAYAAAEVVVALAANLARLGRRKGCAPPP